MTTIEHPPAGPQKVSLTAGSAFKFGFFGALGVFIFYLAVSIIFVVIGLVLAAAGVLGGFPDIWRQIMGR